MGDNPHAAAYAGIPTGKVMLKVALISGGLAGLAGVGTDIRVWKGSSAFDKTYDLERIGDEFTPSTLVASNCHAYTYYAWDEDEMVTTAVGWWHPGYPQLIFAPNLIPLATQEIPVDQLDTPGAFGWMLFVWPASNYYPAGSTAFVPDDWYQTWMGVRYNAYGAWSALRMPIDVLPDLNRPTVIVMAEGKVLAEGSADQIMQNEQVIEAYLGRGLKNKPAAREAAP